MRKLVLGLMVAVAVSAACGDDGGSTPAEDTNGTATVGGGAEEEEYVRVDGGDEYPVETSCIDTNGQYTGTLADGGVFILRDGDATGESFVDFLPSAGADPLSSREPGDTLVDGDDGFVTGTTTVYTQEGANSLDLEFGIVVGDTVPAC